MRLPETKANRHSRRTDLVFLLHGFQGLPFPGSGVARQVSLCDDDDDNRWKDHEEGSYIEVQQSCHRHLHCTYVCGQQTPAYNTHFYYQGSMAITGNIKQFSFHFLHYQSAK